MRRCRVVGNIPILVKVSELCGIQRKTLMSPTSEGMPKRAYVSLSTVMTAEAEVVEIFWTSANLE